MSLREERDALIRRVLFGRTLAAALLGALALSYWNVQVVHGSAYRGLAENNRLRKLPIKPLRGVIYDRRGRVLVENVPQYQLRIDPEVSLDVGSSLLFTASVAGLEPGVLAKKWHDQGPWNLRRYPLVEDLSLQQVARFEMAALEHPEFGIEVDHRRLIRHGPLTTHVLGYLAQATTQDLEVGRGQLALGDLIGRQGIEKRYDTWLRGEKGDRVVMVDSRGRVVEEYHREAAVPGGSLTLTLDLELQREAMESLGEQVGAIVVMDPDNGEVLALASSPSYDGNMFSHRLLSEEWDQLVNDPNRPLQNRALQNVYSPGSLFKIVVAAAGLSEGVIAPNDGVFCGGSAQLYNRRFRCWKRGGHGRVALKQALKESCDVYFYHLGQRLGIERIAAYARKFGLGRTTGIDVGGEKRGLVPDSAWSLSIRKTAWYPGETISVAIGQGPLLVTPLQVAVAISVVANGGRLVTPHLVLAGDTPSSTVAFKDAASLSRIRDALWSVVNDQGTGASARVPGLDVAGKTGTVQVVAQETWIDSDELPFELRDHAWFASFAPATEPRLTVVVFVEHGGKGSRAAAPLARSLYETALRIGLAGEVL